MSVTNNIALKKGSRTNLSNQFDMLYIKGQNMLHIGNPQGAVKTLK